jgi:hypothetical protein
MVDFASTQAQAKEVAPPASCEGGGGGQDEATIAKLLNVSPPLTVDGVDKMYRQTSGDSHHRHHTTSEVCSLASI